MHLVLCSFRRPVLAALLALVASPVLAQTPDEASTRAGLMEQAREALASQSAPPERSAVERGLSWYDNQYLFAKLLGGWKGFHLAGGDFPAGAGLKLGIGYDKALTPADRRSGNRVDLTARGAYSTNGYAASERRRDRPQSRRLARRRRRVRSVLRLPAGGLLRRRHGQPGVEPDQLPPRGIRERRHRPLEAVAAPVRRRRRLFQSAARARDRQSQSVD